jgi:acetyltransferase-like isoleucine patch superfamily enzyme
LTKNIFRRVTNRFLHLLARYAPGATTIRPFLHRLRGMNIQGKVFIGEEVYLENEHPECVEIQDGVEIALRTIIMAHFRGPGRVKIERNVWIGPNCVISAGHGQTIVIGEGSVITAMSVVTTNVAPAMMVRGIPARPVARVTVPMTFDTSFEDFQNGLRPLKNSIME